MSEKKESALRIILVLTIVCAVASALLAFVYQGTRVRIAEQEKAARLRAIKEVLPPFDNDPVQDVKEVEIDGGLYTYYLGRMKGGLVGIAFVGSKMGYGGMIDVMIGVTPDGTVTGIVILKYQETPGLGTKASQPTFRDQFGGKTWQEMELKKDGGDIEAITGATITSRAVTKGVNEALGRFLQNKEKIVEG